MALPTTGQITSLEAYIEYYGDAASPSGIQDLDSLATAYDLVDDDTDGFSGKGRPVVFTALESNVDSFEATLGGLLSSNGGFSTQVKFRWRINSGAWIETGSFNTNEGEFNQIISHGASSGDDVEFQAMAKNEADNNSWQYAVSTRSFIIP